MRNKRSYLGRAAVMGALVLGAALLAPVPAGAEPETSDAPQCYLHDDLSAERLLRRMSLDLRGYVPTVDEYAQVEGKSVVPDEVVDAFLATDEFRVQVRRYHESILWTNPKGVGLINNNNVGTRKFQSGESVWLIRDGGVQSKYRGGDRSHFCQDKPQSELGWDAEGKPIAEFMGTDSAGDWYAEGWVEVNPYWAPNTTIKACAFDAQDRIYYTKTVNGKPVQHSCGDRNGAGPTSCGCGPNLRFCLTSAFQTEIWQSMREQLLRLVDDHTDGARPYSGMLTTKRTWYNGPLMFYKKFQAPRPGTSSTINDYMPSDGVFPADEQIDWTDKSWSEIDRTGVHAGILTLPAYTLRFQTNRGRANRFRIAFAGQYFQPPDVGDYQGCDPGTDDLTRKCVCRKCHETLEPLAAYFGQVIEAGSSMLTDFPQDVKTDSDCNTLTGPNSSRLCRRLYKKVKSSIDADYKIWRLQGLEWADPDHPTVQANFDEGPAGIARWAIDGGLFHRATIKNLYNFLFHREMILDPTSPSTEIELLNELTAEFIEHDDFKTMVKRLVSLPQYRRTP